MPETDPTSLPGKTCRQCERCGMHVTYLSLNMSHYNSTVCRAGAALMLGLDDMLQHFRQRPPQSAYVTHAYVPQTISWFWEKSLLIPSRKTKPTFMAGGIFPCGPQNGDHGRSRMPCSKHLLMQSHPECSLRSESESTWTLVDKRAAMCRAGHWDQATLRQLGRRIQWAFKADRLQRTIDAGTAIQVKVQEAWTRLKAWYRHAGN